MRLLLVNVLGPTSFQYLRKVNGILYDTFFDACRELHLLEDDNHWDLTLADAALSSSPQQIRQLFSIILTTCFPSEASALWNKYKDSMSEDILHRIRITNQNPDIQFSAEIYNEALIMIEDICILISNMPLIHFGMPAPNRPAVDIINSDVQREHQFDKTSLATFVANNEQLLTAEQRNVYDQINVSIAAQQGGLFFLDAPGGTGKTFLISLILARIRSQNHIALAIASSGIAATLLDGGRTAHSALKLPLNVHTNPEAMCNIKKHSGMAEVLRKCKIIIWDECTMAHKHSLEALDRSLKDIKDNTRLFGGALLLLSGDFRQTLPVIPRATYADEVNACLKESYLWRSVSKLSLTINMRVQLQNDPLASGFSEQLLDIGNGKIQLYEDTQFIKFPENFCNMVATKDELINSIFPDLRYNYTNHEWLRERAILAAKNLDVDAINFKIQQSLPGNEITFKSIDTVVDPDEVVNYPVEFLNSLDLPGMPPHNLRLKIGSPIILLRNLNAPRLCNGTRLVIKKIMGNIIEANILSGKFQGEIVLLPRIPMIPSDSPIPFKRLQFPIRLAYAMTINKSQGQTMTFCGLDLENPCFSHGQLYVACSRVGKPSSLFVYTPHGLTKNIVHPMALR